MGTGFKVVLRAESRDERTYLRDFLAIAACTESASFDAEVQSRLTVVWTCDSG